MMVNTRCMYHPVEEVLGHQPVLSSDIFRLLVKLESQKVDVDVDKLAKKLHVPPSYALESTLRRGSKDESENEPGPGAYDLRDPWALDKNLQESACFRSKPRDPSSGSKRITKAKRMLKGTKPRGMTTVELSAPTSSTRKGRKFPFGSRKDRFQVEQECEGTRGEQNPSYHVILSSVQSYRFPKAERVMDMAKPSEYTDDVKLGIPRLWDAQSSYHNREEESTTALFGKSNAKRNIVWNPGYKLPSNAVSDAWNGSDAYFQQKKKVESAIATYKHQLEGNKEGAKLDRSSSLPMLSKERGKSKNAKDEFDALDWVKCQPSGKRRITQLAKRCGLLRYVAQDEDLDGNVDDSKDEVTTSVSTNSPSSTQILQQGQEVDDVFHLVSERKSELDLDDKGVFIAVSFRLPGGMLITIQVHTSKTVGHLKSVLLRRQRRFTSTNSFDLFFPHGKRLRHLDETLANAGIQNRTMLQVIPIGPSKMINLKKN